jgi:tetratricopeptide (TPR) repeat protein
VVTGASAPGDGRARRRGGATLLAAVLLVLATVAAYLPALRGGWVWDDDAYVTENPLLAEPGGLRKIWFSLESRSQYFPLTYTSFRAERALWGLDPLGYHLTNVLLHAANALLVWLLLARLSVPGALFAAALFALHPVQVESVAWVTERKNVLSGLFFFATILAWLRVQEPGERRPRRWYAVSLACFALALSAKTTVAVLPAVLALLLWFREGRVAARRLLPLVPFAALGLGMGLVTVWWERFRQGTAGAEFAYPGAERLLIAGRALPFYLGKLLWPASLAFSYPRWSIDAGDPRQYLWPAAVLGAAAGLWLGRARIGRGPFAAGLFFLVCLLPLIGPFALYTFRYSLVADHYQYLACLGPLALFAAALQRVPGSRPAARAVRLGLPAAVLALCAALTWRQAGIYRDGVTLWRDTLAKNPSSWFARNNLAHALHQQGDLEGALAAVGEALRLKADDPVIHTNRGAILESAGRFDEAIESYREALRLLPGYPPAQTNLGSLLARAGRPAEAGGLIREALRDPSLRARAHLRMGDVHAMEGRLGEAAAAYRRALELRPDLEEARRKLDEIESRPR